MEATEVNGPLSQCKGVPTWDTYMMGAFHCFLTCGAFHLKISQAFMKGNKLCLQTVCFKKDI